MNLQRIWTLCWTHVLWFVAELMFQPHPAAPDSASALNCSVTRVPVGLFKYHLSRPPSSLDCKTCWENVTKTVIALDSAFDPKLVQNLTEDFIVLRVCLDYLHYTRDCFGVWKEAHCRVNCSWLLNQDHHPATVICFGHWCPLKLLIGLMVGAAAAIVVGAPIAWFINSRCRRGGGATNVAASD